MLDWLIRHQKSLKNMFTSRKRKGRWSRSFFGSKDSNKVVVLEEPQNTRDSTSSYDYLRESSLDGLNNAATRPRPTPIAKLRRSGSKIRSILSKRQSKGIHSFGIISFFINIE